MTIPWAKDKTPRIVSDERRLPESDLVAGLTQYDTVLIINPKNHRRIEMTRAEARDLGEALGGW